MTAERDQLKEKLKFAEMATDQMRAAAAEACAEKAQAVSEAAEACKRLEEVSSAAGQSRIVHEAVAKIELEAQQAIARVEDRARQDMQVSLRCID